MKVIKTNGITDMVEIPGSDGWACGLDSGSPDLYEAEELFRDGHAICCNRMVLLHAPEGRALEPIPCRKGQYFSNAVFYEGQIYILLVDFPGEHIKIHSFDVVTEVVKLVTALPLSSVEDCYNLLLHTAPVMLTRSKSDVFQIIWPERVDLHVGLRESFDFREGDWLYFSRWNEDSDRDPEYWDEAVIRSYPTGEILEVLPGAIWDLTDGQHWLLQ